MEVFGRYRLLKQIAVGGMGEIFLARSASVDGFEKDLVIKRILPARTEDEHFVSMFLDEARVTMSLSHPNLVQVFDFGQTDGRYYLAMEHVYGCDLKTLLKIPRLSGEGFPPGIALYTIRGVAKALDYAHKKRGRNGELLNLVHRDVSPDNILVGFEGGVKITDFGIAKAKGQLTKLQAGMIIGKVQYMAPEVANGEPGDPRSDIFSCGAVLWELLAGRQLYERNGEADFEFFERVRAGRFERLSDVKRDVPRRVDKLVMRALSIRPDDRHEDARELVHELQEILTSKYRDCDDYALRSFLAEYRPELNVVGFEDLDLSPPTVASKPVTAPIPPPVDESVALPAVKPDSEKHAEETVVHGPMSQPPPEALDAIAAEFKTKPSVWLLVKMAEICAAEAQKGNALSCYRVAAVKFAQHGLLAQSLFCAKMMIEQRSTNDVVLDVSMLPTLVGKSDERVLPYYFRSGGDVEEMLADLIGNAKSARKITADPPPLLANLGRDGFAQLAKLAPLQRFEAGRYIVTQGESGDTMYLLLNGRVIVHVTKSNGERINVASLAPGDFFGENSFFSGAKRNATVEAVEDAALIEISPSLYQRVMSDNPKAASTLSRFYKERIVDHILATSSTFGLISPPERKELLARLLLRPFPRGTTLVARGGPCEDVFLIKRGNAEIDAEGEEPYYLGAGKILGERAVVEKTPVKFNAVAGDNFEALVLKGRDLWAILQRKPERIEAWLRAASKT